MTLTSDVIVYGQFILPVVYNVIRLKGKSITTYSGCINAERIYSNKVIGNGYFEHSASFASSHGFRELKRRKKQSNFDKVKKKQSNGLVKNKTLRAFCFKILFQKRTRRRENRCKPKRVYPGRNVLPATVRRLRRKTISDLRSKSSPRPGAP